MTTHLKFFIQPNQSVIHHKCFYHLINACADKHGLEGTATCNEHGAYVFTLTGPTAGIQDFTAFLRFLGDSAGRLVIIKEEDAVVPQASAYFHRPDPKPDSHPPEEDAVVPEAPISHSK